MSVTAVMCLDNIYCSKTSCGSSSSSSSSSSDNDVNENKTADDTKTENDKMDLLVLDMDIMSTLLNKKLEADEKCFRYYTAVERYLYKKDPGLKLSQFKFESRTLNDGEVTHVFKPSSKTDSYRKYCKYIPSVAGPIVGAALSALWRS